jgi:hypothetical protein
VYDKQIGHFRRNKIMKTIIYSMCFALTIGLLAGCGSSKDKTDDRVYNQVDRLARPAVNEVFAAAGNGRHKVNDEIAPTGDSGQLANDIRSFALNTAGRSAATANVMVAVLVPDVLVADLNQPTSEAAAYLGSETGGATGGKFGGRKLTDDVVDISLGVIFGNTISALGLAPDDNKEIPTLVSDNVGSGAKHYKTSFPYLGDPR